MDNLEKFKKFTVSQDQLKDIQGGNLFGAQALCAAIDALYFQGVNAGDGSHRQYTGGRANCIAAGIL